MTTYFLSYHPESNIWADDMGFPNAKIITDREFKTDMIQKGDKFLGVLSCDQAAEVCAAGGEYYHFKMHVPYGQRGPDISAERMHGFGASLQRFIVSTPAG